MELLFLGTSSGTPTRGRNVSAAAVKLCQSRRWYLVDCGEGTQHQLLRTALSLNQLGTIFITHVHGDHCYGLPGLLASAALAARTEPLLIVGPAGIAQFIKAVAETTQLHLPYEIEFRDVASSQAIRLADEFDVSAIALSHRVPSYAYAFTECPGPGRLDTERLKADGIPQGPLWGRLMREQQVELADGRIVNSSDYRLPARRCRRIIISGDNDWPQLLEEAARQADVLVHEATYTADVLERIGTGPQHSSAQAVARFAQRVALPNLVLTHFSPRYASGGAGTSTIGEIEVEARSEFSGNLFLAEDFARFVLDRDGGLSRAR